MLVDQGLQPRAAADVVRRDVHTAAALLRRQLDEVVEVRTAVAHGRRPVGPGHDGELARPEARTVRRLRSVENALGVDRRDRRRCSGPCSEHPVVADVVHAGARAERHLEAGSAERGGAAARVGDRVLPDAQEEQRAVRRRRRERRPDHELLRVSVVRRRHRRDDAGRGRDVVGRSELRSRLEHLDRLTVHRLVVRVDRRARERDGRRATRLVGGEVGDPVEEVRVVEAPHERRGAGLGVHSRDLHADELVLGAEVAALRDRLARRRGGRHLLEGHLQRRRRVEAHRRRVELEPELRPAVLEVGERARAIRRARGSAHDALHDAQPLRRVGPAERDVEQSRVLHRPDLLLAQEQVHGLVLVLLQRGRRLDPERVAGPVDPVRLVGVVEVGIEHHPLAAHVQRSLRDREVARGVAVRVRDGHHAVAVVRRAGGADHVDELRPVVLRGNRGGLVPVGLERDAALLVDHPAPVTTGVVAHACAIAAHLSTSSSSCGASGSRQVTWTTTGVRPSGMYSPYLMSSPRSFTGASSLE